MKSILILPCGVSDYNKVTPKFLEKDIESKTPKVFLSIEKWDTTNISEIVLILFDNKYIEEQKQQLTDWIEKKYGLNHGVTIITINPTQSVVETVYEYTKDIDDSSIYIKDFDDKFSLTKGFQPNTVYINSLNEGGITDVEKKSYVQIDSINTILNIVEKDVISPYFCVGLYSFKSSDYFNQTVNKLQKKGLTNLFISHIIYDMILNGTRFTSQMIKDYHDWGSDTLWQSYINSQKEISVKHRKNRLFTFGCSHSTWFSADDTIGESWGEILANKLGFEHWDVAKPNSSIDEIFEEFMKFFTHGELTKDDIVIFNASYPSRLRLSFLKHNFEDGRDEIDSNGFGVIRTPDFHFSEFYDRMESYGIKLDADRQFLRWVNIQEFVHSILDIIGCKYYSWQLEDINFLQVWYHKILLEKKILIDFPIENILTKNVIYPPDGYESWFDWNKINSWPNDDSHLSPKGHYLFAEYLYKKIKNDKL